MTGTVFHAPLPAVIEANEQGKLTELVRGQEQGLLQRLAPLVRMQSVTLDLGRVERIDAAGIAALITLYCDSCKAGHAFNVSNPTARVAEMLALVGMDRIFLSHNAVHPSHSDPLLMDAAA